MSFYSPTDPRIASLKELLSAPKRIAVVAHYNPDGDAIGSTLGLSAVLKHLGHTVTVVMPNDPPGFLAGLQGYNDIVRYTKDQVLATKTIEECDVLFCLDFNRPNRAGGLEDLVAKAPVRVLIDHHQDPDHFEPVMFSDTSACATAQMVYDITDAMGYADQIGVGAATCLYTGLVTDTGSFRFRNTTPHTMHVAASLMERGVDIEAVHTSIMDDNTEDRMRLLGFMLYERMRILPEYDTVIIALSLEDLRRFNFKQGDTEGFVNYGLGIRGTRLAAFFVERPDMVKISLRSKNNLYIDKFLGEHFEGGGHRNAAGGRADGPLKTVVEKFEALLPDLMKQFPK